MQQLQNFLAAEFPVTQDIKSVVFMKWHTGSQSRYFGTKNRSYGLSISLTGASASSFQNEATTKRAFSLLPEVFMQDVDLLKRSFQHYGRGKI